VSAPALIALLATLAAPPSAAGGDGLRIAPYIWIPSITGTIGSEGSDAGLPPGRLDVNFEKFTENLRLGGAMVNLNWRGDRWVGYGDWTYANVRTEAPTSRGTLYSSVEAQVKGNIVQAFGGYAVLDLPDVKLDLAGGLRGYSLMARLELNEGSLAGRETSGSQLWLDAVAAARAVAHLGERWDLYLHADVGGGGSNLTWQLIGAAGYDFSWGGLFAGWRHLAVDYEKGSFKLDIALSGPIVGAVFQL
jgi:hypothetical protein